LRGEALYRGNKKIGISIENKRVYEKHETFAGKNDNTMLIKTEVT